MKNNQNSDDYICDDRIYEPGGLVDQIRSMTDEEFERHIEKLKKQENIKE